MSGQDDHYDKRVAITVGVIVGLGGMLFGYDTGYISGCKEMTPFVETFGELNADGVYYLPSSTDSLITSILSLGTLAGALASAYIAMWFGRRLGLALYILIFCAGVAMQTAGYNVALFSVGRVVAGFGVGGVSCVIPSYQSEVSPAKWRGTITSCYQLFVTVGLTLAAVIVWATKDYPSNASWRIPVGIQLAFAGVTGAGLVFIPESPRWLIVKGREEKARRALARLMKQAPDSEIVNVELASIMANVHHEREQGTVSYADLLWRSGENRLPLRVWTGVLFQTFQQLSGINFIFYYGTTFFTNSGIDNPFLVTIATNVVNIGGSFVSLWAIKSIRRRPLTLYGSLSMGVSQLAVAFTGTFAAASNVAAQKALIFFVALYIIHFASIWGPMAWVLTAEIVPNTARSKCVSLTTGSQWLWNFGIGYATPYLVNNEPGSAGLGAKVFFIWGGCCFLSAVYAFFMVPEVKDLTLEQTDILYRNSSVLKSASYRRKLLDEGVTEDQAYYNAAMPDKTDGSIEHRDLRDDVESKDV